MFGAPTRRNFNNLLIAKHNNHKMLPDVVQRAKDQIVNANEPVLNAYKLPLHLHHMSCCRAHMFSQRSLSFLYLPLVHNKRDVYKKTS